MRELDLLRRRGVQVVGDGTAEARPEQQLRDVQRGLREDVDSLQIWLQFLNIGLVPLLVAFIAVVLAAWGALRRRRAQRTPRGAT